jgi:RimJ/RimL family protein N-acetyltransferase
LIGATEDCEELESVATDLPHLSIIPYVSDMSAQYRWADIAIAGGGSSNWEMCLFGLPRLVVVLAENQRQVAGQLAEYGSALNLGPAAELTSEMVAQSIRGLVSDMSLRESLSSRSKTLVDGYGAKRVVDQLMWANLRTSELTLAAEGLQIRPATWADSGLLLNWRNDSSTRIASRNHAEITPERHQQWLRETLSGQTRRLFIAETDRAPVGTIRLDFADEVEISWTVAPASRGAGWGKKMVMLVAESVNCDLVACVRTENVASQKIAEAAGFKTAGQHDNMLIYRRSS